MIAPAAIGFVTNAEHHGDIPLNASRGDKILVHLRETPPVAETRPLAAYERLAAGGAR